VNTAVLIGALGGLATLAAFAFAAKQQRRAGVLAGRVDELEADSLQQRREIWRLQKSKQPATPSAAPAGDAGGTVPARLAAVCLEIGAELHENRVLEATVRGVLRVLGSGAARVVLHDRRTDRFVGGAGATHRDGAIVLSSEAPRPTEDLLLRATIRRRGHLLRQGGDPATRSLFDAAGEAVTAVAPLFDRALVTGLLVVEGTISTDTADVLDVLATTCSLAVANARARTTSTGAAAQPSETSHV
jgi:hypothetical protein